MLFIKLEVCIGKMLPDVLTNGVRAKVYNLQIMFGKWLIYFLFVCVYFHVYWRFKPFLSGSFNLQGPYFKIPNRSLANREAGFLRIMQQWKIKIGVHYCVLFYVIKKWHKFVVNFLNVH